MASTKQVTTKDNTSSMAHFSKQVDEICLNGLMSESHQYESKMALFNIRSAIVKSNTSIMDFDPVITLFGGIEILEQKQKSQKEDFEAVIIELNRTGGKLPPNLAFLLWMRLIQHAYKNHQLHIAYFCIRSLFLGIGNNIGTLKSFNPPEMKLLSEGELLYGHIILSLAKSNQLYDERSKMRIDALNRFTNCIELLCSNTTLLPLMKASLLECLEFTWTVLQEMSGSTELNIAIKSVQRALSSIFNFFMMNNSTREIIMESSELQILIIDINQFCINFFTSKKDLHSALRYIERIYRILPSNQHEKIWKIKIDILHQSGKGTVGTLLKELDAETQSDM
jgi:hypothetical protein